MSLLNKIKDIVAEAKEHHASCPTAVFKLFVSTVLVQFAILSLISIQTNNRVQDLNALEKVIESSHYWWGTLGLFGAAALSFERYIKDNLVVMFLGYASAISSLALLSYDFSTQKPPVYTGGILAATAVVFLGGLFYGWVKRR